MHIKNIYISRIYLFFVLNTCIKAKRTSLTSDIDADQYIITLLLFFNESSSRLGTNLSIKENKLIIG